MITGFNTDVEHEGVVYHVQTEDKGLKSPLLLSLVYVGGTILASKRTPYDDLVSAQLANAKGDGDLQALLGSGDTWSITEISTVFKS